MNYSNLKNLINQLYRVRVEQEDGDEKETASTRLADLISITIEYLHNNALVLVLTYWQTREESEVSC